MHCILATVQALVRPLKKDETRSSLARKARLMVASRQGVKLPANLDMLLNKMAATMEKLAEVVQTGQAPKAAAETTPSRKKRPRSTSVASKPADSNSKRKQ